MGKLEHHKISLVSESSTLPNLIRKRSAGIWIGLMSLVACNFVADSIRITRKDSPVAAVLELDIGLSIDESDDEVEISATDRRDS